MDAVSLKTLRSKCRVAVCDRSSQLACRLCQARFGTVLDAMLSLFMSITNGISYVELLTPLAALSFGGISGGAKAEGKNHKPV